MCSCFGKSTSTIFFHCSGHVGYRIILYGLPHWSLPTSAINSIQHRVLLHLDIVNLDRACLYTSSSFENVRFFLARCANRLNVFIPPVNRFMRMSILRPGMATSQALIIFLIWSCTFSSAVDPSAEESTHFSASEQTNSRVVLSNFYVSLLPT